jgi:hypothetical protein
MAEATYSKFDIASNQLESAIGMFVSSRDRFSVITLAGAADSIFIELVRRAGKKDFSEYVQAVSEAKGEKTPSLSTVRSHINDVLQINAVKHFGAGDPESITLDSDQCALGAILKAMANLKKLTTEDPPYVKAMLAWTWQNLQGERIMASYEKRPERVKKYEAKEESAESTRVPDKRTD